MQRTGVFEAPLERVVLDEATDNTVRDNTFTDVTYGVHVEDDRTTVVDNVFRGSDPGDYAVIVGTRLRTTVLDHPVTDTVVAGNQSRIVGNPSPYRWVNGQLGTAMSHNLALRRPAGICQAPEIPHNIMIMVIAAAAETPGQPPPATAGPHRAHHRRPGSLRRVRAPDRAAASRRGDGSRP